MVMGSRALTYGDASTAMADSRSLDHSCARLLKQRSVLLIIRLIVAGTRRSSVNAWRSTNQNGEIMAKRKKQAKAPKRKAAMARGKARKAAKRTAASADYYYHRHRGLEFRGPGFNIDVGR